MLPSLVPSLLFFVFCFPSALSFNVTIGSSPTECGPLNVTWTGGQAPFQIGLIPVYDVPRNISIPSTAFNNNQGSYQISSIPFLKGAQFLLVMSDATGFGKGGTSELLTVGAPVGSASCNTTNPSLPFTFNLPSSLQQCSPYTFDGYDGAALPITVVGLIPGGDSFLLYTPSTGTTYTWVADVAAGTTIIFTVTDAKGNSGGSSDTETVALSNDASCLNANSPSSTVSSVPSSTSAASSSTPSSTQSPTQSTSGISTGTIIGVALGGVAAISAVIALAAFYLRRHYRRSQYGPAPTGNSRRSISVELDPGTDNFQPPPLYPFPYQSDSVSQLAPPIIPGSRATSALYRELPPSTDPSVHASEALYTPQQSFRASSTTDGITASGDIASTSMSTGGRRKAAMAGMTTYQPATRFIVHTDAEDLPVNQVEVVELPPQYSERGSSVTRLTAERPVSSVTGPSSSIGQLAGEPPQSTSHPLSAQPH